jgi:alpha-ribazole phosphatase
MASLFVARHPPIDLEVGTYAGQLDVPSTRDPFEIADALLSTWTGGADVRSLWSSSLRRCSEVASVLAARWGVPHRIDSRLLEISYGRWESRRWEEIERVDGDALHAWMTNWERQAPPGGESAAMVEARVRAWWQSLRIDEDEVLIAHAGVIRALHVISAGCSWDDAMQISVPHAAWTRIAKR